MRLHLILLLAELVIANLLAAHSRSQENTLHVGALDVARDRVVVSSGDAIQRLVRIQPGRPLAGPEPARHDPLWGNALPGIVDKPRQVAKLQREPVVVEDLSKPAQPQPEPPRQPTPAQWPNLTCSPPLCPMGGKCGGNCGAIACTCGKNDEKNFNTPAGYCQPGVGACGTCGSCKAYGGQGGVPVRRGWFRGRTRYVAYSTAGCASGACGVGAGVMAFRGFRGRARGSCGRRGLFGRFRGRCG